MGYSTNGTRSWRESLDSPEFVLSDNLRVGEVYKVQCDLLTDREQTDQITCNIDLHASPEQPWNVRVENFAPGLQKVTWSAPKINCNCPYLYVIEQRAMGDDSGHVKYMHVQSKQNQGKEDIQLDFGPRFTPNLTITWSAVDEVMVSWDLGCSTGLKFDVIAQSDVTELRRRILGEPGLPEYTKLRVSACMSYLVYLDFLVGELRSPSNFLVLNGSFKITMKQIKAENIDTSVQRISWEELPDDSWCAEDVYQVTQTQESEKMSQAHNLSFGETFEPGRPVRVSASFIEPGRLSVRWLPPNTSLEITAFEFIVTALSISDAKADVRYNMSSLSAITMSVAHCTDYMVYVQTCDVKTGEISERSTGVLVMSQTPKAGTPRELTIVETTGDTQTLAWLPSRTNPSCYRQTRRATASFMKFPNEKRMPQDLKRLPKCHLRRPITRLRSFLLPPRTYIKFEGFLSQDIFPGSTQRRQWGRQIFQ
ncbi:hypothetical protein CSKR_108389, partial [Clonorchis sinensis]